MNITAAFWDVAPCSLVAVDRLFKCADYVRHQGGGDCTHL
jgi:hypothetical protein